jgi:hypothetical protein
VEQEGAALGRRQRFEHHEQRHTDRLVERDPVGKILVFPAGRDKRLGQPGADVLLAAGPRGGERVDRQPRDHRR